MAVAEVDGLSKGLDGYRCIEAQNDIDYSGGKVWEPQEIPMGALNTACQRSTSLMPYLSLPVILLSLALRPVHFHLFVFVHFIDGASLIGLLSKFQRAFKNR